MSEEGRKRLKDLAKDVRAKVSPQGAPLLHQRGLDLVDELAKELAAPDGMPGLKIWRDSPAKFRLTRAPRNAEIAVEWQRDIGALVLTSEKHGEPKKLVRYVWDDGATSWRRLEGGGEVWEDLAATLVEVLFPEGKK